MYFSFIYFFLLNMCHKSIKECIGPYDQNCTDCFCEKIAAKSKNRFVFKQHLFMKMNDPVPNDPFCLLVNGNFKILGKIMYLSIFLQGLTSTRELPETGADLAMRALGWASLYSVGGFSLFCYGVWKMMGVSNVSMLISGLHIVKDLFLISQSKTFCVDSKKSSP